MKPTRQELYERAVDIIKSARESTKLLMREGLIKKAAAEEDKLKT